MSDKITTFLWFEKNAKEAAEFYVSLFPGSRITESETSAVSFELLGQRYMAFNGGPHYKLSAAVSIFVLCDTQAEIDAFWEKFIGNGGTEVRCGWLEDKFGLSWQIIPRRLHQLLGHPDKAKAKRVHEAMMTMQKLDIAALERAAAETQP